MKMANLSGGEGQRYFEEEIKFFQSQKVQIDLRSKRIKLGGKLSSNALATIQNEKYVPLFSFLSTLNYHLAVVQATGDVRLYKSTGAGAFSTAYTFTAENGEDEVYGLFRYKDKLIASFMDSSTDYVFYYSTSPSSAWTKITTLPNELFKNFLIIDNVLYLFTTGSIYTSTDGITFTLYLTMPTNVLIKSIDFFDGFIYISTYQLSFGFKYSLMRIENDELVFLRNFPDESIILASSDFLYIFIKSSIRPRVLSFDGASYKLFYDFREFSVIPNALAPLVNTDDKFYFMVGFLVGSDQQEHIYSIVKDKAVFREFSFANNEFIRSMYDIDDVLYSLITLDEGDPVSSKIYNDDAVEFEALGSLESSILDVGEVVPIQAILRHKPLSASTSVKLYVKKNQASSWGSAVLTSDTDDAVNKKYRFPKSSIYDFIQFKIELITTDDTVTPEDVQLIFLYKPLGLEVAN